MTRLVAIDPLIGGALVLEEVRRTWEDGDAVLVLPRPAPDAAIARLLGAARPHELVEASGSAGTRRVDLGRSAPSLEEGDALVAASSGSTGEPKLLVHTRAGLTAHAKSVHDRLSVDPARDRWLACLPLHHLGGFGVLARAVLTDTPVTVDVPFDRGRVAAAPATKGATLVSLVPTALDRIDPSSYRWIVLGGAHDPTTRPGNVVRTYGLTETGGGIVYDGRPLPGVEIRLLDGEIWIRTPTLARGRRAVDGSVASIADDDGWLATGDLGRFDGDRLVVEGRADDLIVTGGENVWPEPVEASLRDHPAVADALVHGEPDPTWGQRVVARVVAADPAAPPSPASLRAHVAGTIGAHAAPKSVHLVDHLERTALGKLVRPRLERSRTDPGGPNGETGQ